MVKLYIRVRWELTSGFQLVGIRDTAPSYSAHQYSAQFIPLQISGNHTQSLLQPMPMVLTRLNILFMINEGGLKY